MTRRTLFELPADPNWVDDAACRGKPPEYWHPPPSTKSPFAYTIGRVICATCPVQRECLDTAIVRNELYGLWGATTPKQRHRIRRGATVDYPCRLCTKRIRHSAATPARHYCYECHRKQRARVKAVWEENRKANRK